MEYPKPIMTTPELKKMGFTRTYLERSYRSKDNTFATKISPGKSCSMILYETDGFEKWRQREIAAQRGKR